MRCSVRPFTIGWHLKKFVSRRKRIKNGGTKIPILWIYYSLSLSFSLVQYNNISIKPCKTFPHWIPKIWLYFLYLRLAFESIHKKLLMAFSYCVYNRANDDEKPIYNFFAVFPSEAEWKLKQQQKSDFVTF